MTDRNNAETSREEWQTPQERHTFPGSYEYITRSLQANYRFEVVYGEPSHHIIYKLGKPPAIPGINYPDSFKVWNRLPVREWSTLEDRVCELLAEYLEGLEEESRGRFYKFWSGFLTPSVRNQDFENFSERLVREKAEDFKSGKPTETGIMVFPEDYSTQKPMKWVPKREWFDPQIQALRLKDLIGLFPGPELEVFQLILGRILVGPGESVNGYGQEVTHRARLCGVLKGSPGIGKTYLMTTVSHTLAKLGYRTATMKNLATAFGWETVAQADLSYQDDSTVKGFKGFCASAEAKSVISNQILEVQKKGKNHIDVRSQTVIVLNLNDFDPRTLWDADSGMKDRVAILSCLTPVELEKTREVAGLTLNRKPFDIFTSLAKQMGVSEESLMAWVFVQAAEYFQCACNEGLPERVKSLKSNLQIDLGASYTTRFLSFVHLLELLHPGYKYTEEIWLLPSLARPPKLNTIVDRFSARLVSKKYWERAYSTPQSDRIREGIESLKDDFFDPFQGAANHLAYVATSVSYVNYHEFPTPQEWVKELFKAYRANNGLEYSSDLPWLLSYNGEILPKVTKLYNLKHDILRELDPDPEKAWYLAFQDTWVWDLIYDYDPKYLDRLRDAFEPKEIEEDD